MWSLGSALRLLPVVFLFIGSCGLSEAALGPSFLKWLSIFLPSFGRLFNKLVLIQRSDWIQNILQSHSIIPMPNFCCLFISLLLMPCFLKNHLIFLEDVITIIIIFIVIISITSTLRCFLEQYQFGSFLCRIILSKGSKWDWSQTILFQSEHIYAVQQFFTTEWLDVQC